MHSKILYEFLELTVLTNQLYNADAIQKNISLHQNKKINITIQDS